MTCRCASPAEHTSRAMSRQQVSTQGAKVRQEKLITELKQEIAGLTIKSNDYEIVEASQVNSHLVLKVSYPSCKNCEFEGTKVMVFLHTTASDALRWKRIDPHFRNEKGLKGNEAPSPAARFPATPDGWNDALEYAERCTL